MVMDRCHQQQPPAFSVFLFCIFEPAPLQNDGNALHQEDAAQDRQQQFLSDEHGADSDDSAHHQAARITHKDLGRVGVVPQETDKRSDEGGKEYRNLS